MEEIQMSKKNDEGKINGKTVDEILATLTDEQKKAVAVFVAVAVQQEIDNMDFSAIEEK